MRKNYILFLLLICIVSSAQTKKYSEHASAFLMTSLTYNHSKQWMGYIELQGRSIENFTPIDYYEIKGGIGYNLMPKNQVLIGVGRYATYKEERLSQEELRLWLQYTYSFNINRVKFDNRFRAEKRFFHNPVTDENTNDERYRLRTNVTVPVNKEKVTEKTFFVNAFAEVFVGPKEPTFKRNRLYTGVGYQFTKAISSNLGYMWQRENYIDEPRNLHFIYMALNFTINNKNAEPEKHILPIAD